MKENFINNYNVFTVRNFWPLLLLVPGFKFLATPLRSILSKMKCSDFRPFNHEVQTDPKLFLAALQKSVCLSSNL
jgi:hypothetical protein